jgi:hypothetical protein
MGWGSIAEKLNRTIGGYGSEEEKAEKLEAKAEPKAETPWRWRWEPEKTKSKPEKTKSSDDPMQWVPRTKNSIYDVPAITRESVPVEDAPVKASKPRRARKPKQESAPKEQVAAVAT